MTKGSFLLNTRFVSVPHVGIERMKQCVLIGALMCAAVAVHAQRPSQPNFLLVYADDLGWQDPKVYDNMATNVLGTSGGTNVYETPYMDALASEGVLFREAYSPQCVCAPSRAAILTSQAPARLNFTTVSGGSVCPQPGGPNSRMITAYHNQRLEAETVTLPELLEADGYLNGHIGKWHLSGPGPLEHGFHYSNGHRGVQNGMADRLSGFATTNATDAYQLQDISGQASTNGFAFDQMTQNGLDFLAQAAVTNKPFFCYFATWLVHSPWQIRTERLLEKYALRMGYSYPLTGAESFPVGQNHPIYAAMVETFDYNLHQLMTFLRNTDDPRWPGHKLVENTYIILTSDNGGMENGEPSGTPTDNYPLRGGKINQEEGGTRVPFLAVGPGIASNIVSDVMINGLDLMPTILSLAGSSVPSGLDGLDLTTLLLSDPTDRQLVTNAVGDVRDTMYWHFPHSGQDNASIRKGGWKLYHNFDNVNHGGPRNPYRLYQLYDTNGVRVDIEEDTDLWDDEAYTNVTAELAADLHGWLDDVGANVPYYNPDYPANNLPGQSEVPAVTANGRAGDVVWIEFETNKSEVVRVDLLYTYAGFSVNQTWLRKVGTITEPGRAEVSVPTGTTHYVFNLVDENNFMVSYPSVGTGNDGIPDSALALSFADPVYVNPGPQDVYFLENFSSALAGGGLTRDSVGFRAGGAWEIDSGRLSNTSLVNNSTAEGAAGVIIDLASLEDPTVNEFTLSFDYTLAEYTETLFVHVWGYIDHSSSSNTAIMNHGAQNGNVWEIASPTYMFSYNFGNPNGEWLGSNRGEAGDAAISLAGFSSPDTYQRTFDLSGYTTASNTLGAYDYLVVAFTRSIAGSAPAATIDNVMITVPTSNQYARWAYDAGLSSIPDNSNPDLNTVTSGGLNRGQVGWRKSSGSAWTVNEGILGNASTENNNVAEGAIARAFSLSPFSNLDSGELSLQFDYSTKDAAEKLFVHLWGYAETTNTPPSIWLMNLGAQSGNAWQGADTNLVSAFNLGKPDGAFLPTAGNAADAAAVLTGSTGEQSYSSTFDLSGFAPPASNTVAGYDTLVLAFAREIAGAVAPEATVRNIVLAVPGGDTIFSFLRAEPEDGVLKDPDSDDLVNLLEYALGGDPTGGVDVGILPVPAVSPDGNLSYQYRRRIDHAARGLTYTVQRETNLVAGAGWTTNGCVEVGSSPIDAGFESVSNRLQKTDVVFGRLVVGIE